MSRNFYLRTCVKFTFANNMEAMHERSLVSVKVEPHLTSRLSSALFILPLFYLHDWNLRALTCVAKNASVVHCKTVGFFLKTSKEIGKAWRKGLSRARRASRRMRREKKTPLASLPSLALCFQFRSRPFVWLIARTWISKNTDCFANQLLHSCCRFTIY